MKLKWILAIAVLIAIVAFVSLQAKQKAKKPAVATTQNGIETIHATDNELPVFSMQGVDGKIVTLQSFKGKKVFVNLWASWCPPCKREMPSIEKLYKSADTAKVAFVLIALDDQFEKSQQFMQARSFKVPIYYPAENLPALFNVEGIPATFIFDETGKLMHQVEGSDDYDTDFYKKLLK